jgi:LacI family transcriptional regulator
MKKVTIKDIAAILNTSPHTVSKALNNKPGVSEELRQKIKQMAQELHYVPNIFGRGLSGKTLKTIGIIIANDTNPAYSVIISGLEKKAAQSGYNIILCYSNEDIHVEEDLIRVLLEKRVDGMIISPVDHPKPNHNIEILQQFGVPYVLLARAIENQEHPCVKSSNSLGAYLAGQYLIQKGHVNVIYVTRKYSITAVEERIEGLHHVFQDQHLPFPEKNIYRQCTVSIESGYTEMLNILKERRDFTAVFAFNDIIAFGIMKAVHECRLRIPGDIAIMGFDNLIFSEICLVPLTTVNQNLFALGAISMEALLNKVEEKENASYTEMPEPYIVERQSV